MRKKPADEAPDSASSEGYDFSQIKIGTGKLMTDFIGLYIVGEGVAGVSWGSEETPMMPPFEIDSRGYPTSDLFDGVWVKLVPEHGEVKIDGTLTIDQLRLLVRFLEQHEASKADRSRDPGAE